MPDQPPKGVLPLFLRGVTLEKFGLKTGDDLVEYKFIPKEDIMKEIQVMGVMSDFEPGKKVIEPFQGDQILIFVDQTQKYGEATLLCYTNEARDEMLKDILEQQEALKEQLLAEQRVEEERIAAELARQNIVYEDKPITPNTWVSLHSHDTDQEIKQLSFTTHRDPISIEIQRPKRFTKQAFKLNDRNADVGGVAEFRATKDPNFRAIKEADRGIQIAPQCQDMAAQTTFYRSVNKSVQYESASVQSDTSSVPDTLLAFLEKATVRVEQALQQNESVDIFLETNRLVGDEEGTEGAQVENELREVRNFADAVYSKSKVLPAIDWMPKTQGMVAVSAARNVSFDQRIPILGQTHTSYILLWDFRVLVKPLVLLQSHHEIFTFRFNRADPTYIVGGCITGQVMLWEVTEAINSAQRRNNSSSGGGSGNSSSPNANVGNGISSLLGGVNSGEDDEEQALLPVMPLHVSSVDHSHKKCVADLFWLPPTSQINYRGQLVREEFLDSHSYQFITIAGDGMIMVWDIRYEKIFNDELRHIGRPKHVPTEKSSTKEGGGVKPLWGPIFKTHLKRLEGVGELSLCKICDITNSKLSQLGVGKKPNNFQGDSRSQFIIATEEGDIIFTDLSSRKDMTANNANKEEEEDDDNEVSCVKWMAMDHPRPSVHLQESPFFPQIVLSISDWNFHIWKVCCNIMIVCCFQPYVVSFVCCNNYYYFVNSWEKQIQSLVPPFPILI